MQVSRHKQEKPFFFFYSQQCDIHTSQQSQVRVDKHMCGIYIDNIDKTLANIHGKLGYAGKQRLIMIILGDNSNKQCSSVFSVALG